MEKTPILVVEDEEAICRGLCDVLAFKGYAPTAASTGNEGLERALAGHFPLVLLDVMLPGIDGFSICRRVRADNPAVAILMLTAKGSEADVLEGFQAGADDYVTKPFSVAQLLARVDALLRRTRARTRRHWSMGNIAIDADNYRAGTDESSVDITARDVEVLEYFAAAAGRVVSREELLKEVWGYARVDKVETRCIDMHIAKLRKKLARIDAVSLIETVRGAGYRYDRSP
jgi:two-component system response regulator RegX3